MNRPVNGPVNRPVNDRAPRTLVVRLDSLGDVLITGPAVRALAHTSSSLTYLAGPRGAAAAALLPGVDEVLSFEAPWIVADPGPVDPAAVDRLRAALAERSFDRAVIFTSFHQSALPSALLLRLAGVPWIGAISEHYPGSLLDLRHPEPAEGPEPERMLELALACGGELPEGDDGRLAVRLRTPDVTPLHGAPYVVLHPGTSVPARAWPAEHFRVACAALVELGHRVLVTGGPDEQDLTAFVAEGGGVDLGGRLDLPELARVLADADAVVVGNTGPAHLAAAVGTPVISLFAPTVPRERWAPYAVRSVVLGDQGAPCAGSRATACPVAGHPCLASVRPGDVVAAVGSLCGHPGRAATEAPPPREPVAVTEGVPR